MASRLELLMSQGMRLWSYLTSSPAAAAATGGALASSRSQPKHRIRHPPRNRVSAGSAHEAERR
uniref:Uncharacterized protein n=1 Tax=Aegilops tauschii subsp. strangulata TaxID=200361 RepID=A0A453J6H4_AEGTS